MKLSQIAAEIQRIIENHGDVEMCMVDACRILKEIELIPANDSECTPEFVNFGTY